MNLPYAKVTYYCAYCGHEFAEKPKLPTRCPKCGKTLRELGKPVIEVKIRKKRLSFEDVDMPGTSPRTAVAQGFKLRLRR